MDTATTVCATSANPPTEKDPTSDILFRVTQSATETVSRLLNCTGSACAQDASMLLVLGAILHKVLTWYQALYQSEIGVLFSSAPSAQPDANLTRPPLEPHPSNSGSGDQLMLSRQVGGTGDSVYTVPLTIPLSVGPLNISRATETKMKAQLLLCQLQSLHQVCQGLDRRVRGAESMRGEENLCEGSNTQLLEKVDELQRVLAAVCTQTPM
ncbi:Ribosomal protein L10e/L16 [Penicillium mononematosum]|uniref:Ribosomal protein L10e/L16 n=1 Tax=Penicillium mononematosum TaxID=268346 RepID=UPI0025470BE0|nr:Ribosomal protein L10e/L16 [Penicillium mononematosum]KAJ6186024.1 Ribosomal protein L10e/L16 [Penicillium mononematosum]